MPHKMITGLILAVKGANMSKKRKTIFQPNMGPYCEVRAKPDNRLVAEFLYYPDAESFAKRYVEQNNVGVSIDIVSRLHGSWNEAGNG